MLYMSILMFSMIVIAMLAMYLVDKRSISGKIVRAKIEDIEVVENFKKTQITGKEFLNKILNLNGVFNYKISTSKKAKSVVCFPRLIVVNKDFEEPLTLETFNTSIHELKHVIDKPLMYLKYFFDGIFLICAILIVFNLSTFITFQNIKTIYVICLTSYIILSIFGYIAETRARRFVDSDYTHKMLINLDMPSHIIKKVLDYLSIRIKNEIFWHNATSTCLNLLIITSIMGLMTFNI